MVLSLGFLPIALILIGMAAAVVGLLWWNTRSLNRKDRDAR
jgi:UDP-N-acetylmuramyl pentapeptide phosphotransferase/UDP-N-acetylglucosamine-1-phosphate transferase